MIIGKDIGVLVKNMNNNKKHINLQYTGLKDKNGAEIYESDIVIQSDDEPREVKFVNGEWVLNNHLSLFYYELNTLEVIGNIYENKGLLDGKV